MKSRSEKHPEHQKQQQRKPKKPGGDPHRSLPSKGRNPPNTDLPSHAGKLIEAGGHDRGAHTGQLQSEWR